MSQSPEIQELKKAIEAVKKNTVKELASMTQDLIDLTHEGKIEQFLIMTSEIRKIALEPYNQFTIRVILPIPENKNERKNFYLGVGEEDEQNLLGDSKIKGTDLAKKLIEINNSLSIINGVCKSEIPSHIDKRIEDMNKNNNRSDNIMFMYSLNRLNLNGNWTEANAKDWPMIPSYLEPLVDLNGTKNVPASSKKRKP